MRRDGSWTVKFDNISETETVESQTDVHLNNKQAFIGGRPGHEYEYWQMHVAEFQFVKDLSPQRGPGE